MSEPSGATHPDAQSRWKTIAWVVGPLTVVLVVAYVLFRPTSEPEQQMPSASSSMVAEATPTPFPTPDLAPVEVASLSVDASSFDARATISEFALAGGRVIAVGSNGAGAAAWYSDDRGASWRDASVETLAVPAPGATAEMAAVAVHGGTVVAVGQWHRPREGLPLALSTWVSNDAGATWTERPRDDQPSGGSPSAGGLLTATDFGFVTVRITSFPSVLVSVDGAAWTNLEESGNGLAKADIRLIAGRANSLVAVGLDRRGTESTILTPDAWNYTEAEGWTTLDGRFRSAIVGDLAADASGFYAAGITLPDPQTTAGSLVTMWDSEDGESWRQRVLSQTPDLENGPIAHGPMGTLVFGDSVVPPSDEPELATYAWFVPSGATTDDPPQEYRVDWQGRAAIALEDRFIMFGVCPRDAASCDGPAIVTFSASDELYVTPSAE